MQRFHFTAQYLQQYDGLKQQAQHDELSGVHSKLWFSGHYGGLALQEERNALASCQLVVKPWVGSVCNSSTVLAVASLVAWSDSYSSPLSHSISILHPVGVQASFRELMGKWVTIVTGLNTV